MSEQHRDRRCTEREVLGVVGAELGQGLSTLDDPKAGFTVEGEHPCAWLQSRGQAGGGQPTERREVCQAPA